MSSESDGRDVVVGLVVTAGRAGANAGKVAAKLPLVRGRMRDLATAGRDAEADARRRIESAATEIIDEDRIVERVVSSPQFEEALLRVLTSPAVRVALSRQTATVGEQLVAELRVRARRLDGEPLPYAGVASRGLALAVDALVAALVFLIGAGVIGVVASLGARPSTWVGGTVLAVGWVAVQIVYFAGSWRLAGATPGMRLLGLRVSGPDGAAPGVARSLVRLVGLWLAIAVLFLGFAPALFDKRRRALQDFLARTVVLYAG